VHDNLITGFSTLDDTLPVALDTVHTHWHHHEPTTHEHYPDVHHQHGMKKRDRMAPRHSCRRKGSNVTYFDCRSAPDNLWQAKRASRRILLGASMGRTSAEKSIWLP
jgi:hypothetical protein